MGLPLSRPSIAEFLNWEASQPERHELVHGEIFAMVGASHGHHRVVQNLVRDLADHLEGGPCRVYSETMKLQAADDTVVYPDVFVVCGQASAHDTVLQDPLLVMEVLSPGTSDYDRGAKAVVYRRMTSLRELVLVDPERRQAEVFRRTPDGAWQVLDVAGTAALSLLSVDLTVPLSRVFRDLGV